MTDPVKGYLPGERCAFSGLRSQFRSDMYFA
jgi:hypothetical protein